MPTERDNHTLSERVSHVEGAIDTLRGEMGGLRRTVEEQSKEIGRIGSLVEGVSIELRSMFDQMRSGDNRTAERAQAVKKEIGEEAERKARERSALLRDGLALIGAVSVIVAAWCGPYLSKLNATADGREQDAAAIGAVREIIAQQGADILRNRDGEDIAREARRRQQDKIDDLELRLGHLEGAAGR